MNFIDAIKLNALKSLPPEQINPADILAVCENKPDAFKAQVVEILRAKGLILPAGNMQPEIEAPATHSSSEERTQAPQLVYDPETMSDYVKVYTHLPPMARHITKIPSFHLYTLCKTIDVQHNGGEGLMSLDMLRSHLSQYHWTYSNDHTTRLLKKGEGIYWERRSHNRIKLNSWEKVTETLTAAMCKHGLKSVADVCTPRPAVWLQLSGSLKDVTATLYAAWIDNQPGGFIGASREFLAKVWNVRKTYGDNERENGGIRTSTLLEWERGRVESDKRITRYAGSDPSAIESHAQIYRTTDGVIRYYWRIPNGYSAVSPVPEHPHKGQLSKIRKAYHRTLKAHALDEAPPDECTGGIVTPGKRYFYGKDVRAGLKDVQAHLGKYQDWQNPHHVHIETRRGKHSTQSVQTFERYDPPSRTLHTNPNEVDFRAVHDPSYRAMSAQFTHVWGRP